MTGPINDPVGVAKLGVGFFPLGPGYLPASSTLCKTAESRPELRQRWSQTGDGAIPGGGSSDGACSAGLAAGSCLCARPGALGTGWERIIKILHEAGGCSEAATTVTTRGRCFITSCLVEGAVFWAVKKVNLLRNGGV